MSHLRTRMPVHPEMFKQAMEQRDAALAEVARLREALERISAILPCSEPYRPRRACSHCSAGHDDPEGDIDCTGCIARAALATATAKGG